MMRLELVRIVADALLHTSYGVNKKLVTVPRDGTGPDKDPPPQDIVAVYDETRDNHVAARQAPPKWPCLYVMLDGDIRVTGDQMTGTYRDIENSAFVAVRYLGARNEVAAAIRDGDYTLRAALRSIVELMDQANDAARTRNSICVFNLASATYVPAREAVGEAVVTGVLLLEFDKVRDAAPLTGG